MSETANRMSDVDSRDNVNGDLAEQDNICRDFLRNVCRRGKRCKYRHPDPSEAKEMGRKIDYIFCHDYQNKECRRPNCKFIHCTRAEEEYYHATGELPQRVMDSISMGQGNGGDINIDNDIPICKDFLKGECRRGGRCKFRHVNPSEFDMDMGGVGRRRDQYGMFNQGFDNFEFYEPERKRRMFGDFGNGGPLPPPPNRQPMPPPQQLPSDYYILEEENAFLRRKIEELRKQVTDLTATNEFLLDQNAQLRLGKQNTVSPVTPSMNPNSIGGTPNAVPSAIAQMSQQLPMNNDLSAAAQSSMQPPPHMAQELAAATPQNIPPIVPVSLSSPAMAPVSIASVSLTPQIPAASLAQSLPQNPLVSYPIMTQSMRPAIPQSNLTH